MIGVVTAPTPYADLNDLLDRFVRGAQTALGENFCGAYLQGSFAVGDADEYSDVDFIVLTTDEITDDQQTALQEMHARMYELETPWAQHLEGSYIPRGRIRHVDPTRAPYFYLDNGASRLEWDNHCNTAIVRWSLREHGLVLAGPEIKTLVDPVTAGQLRADVREAMRECRAFAHQSQERFEVPGEGRPGMSRWKQQFLIQWFCRALHTLESGVVTSKKESGEWALDALGPQWSGLVQQALDDRPEPWQRVHQAADAERIAHTLAFVDYALDRAGLP